MKSRENPIYCPHRVYIFTFSFYCVHLILTFFSKYADTVTGVDQYAIRAFADALDDIPLALAENSGLSPIEEVAAAKSRQVKDANSNHVIGIGVDKAPNEDGSHSTDMREIGVFETLIGKQEQVLLAVQVTKMILKIDDVISMRGQ